VRKSIIYTCSHKSEERLLWLGQCTERAGIGQREEEEDSDHPHLSGLSKGIFGRQ